VTNVFGSTRIKVDKGLLEKARRCAALAGYSSVEELVTHALEKHLAQLEEADSEAAVTKRLRGLGYIS